MKCPACKSPRLEPFEPEPGLVASRCTECRGLFIPFEKFFSWQTRNAAIHPEVGVVPSAPAGECGPSSTTDSGGGKLCPGCGRFMTRFRVSLDLPFNIDRCGGCAGVWLDRGEWEQLRAVGQHLRLHALFSDSWQHHLAEEERRRQHEARYRTLIGDEFFRRVREFKEWLDVHPQREVVLAYLGDKAHE